MNLSERIEILKLRLNRLIEQGYAFTDAIVLETSQDLDQLLVLQVERQYQQHCRSN